MTCGGEIGSADRYNRALCREKGLSCMGTAQIVMPENYIAMFDAPQADEARQDRRQGRAGHRPRHRRHPRRVDAFPPTRNNLYDRFDERPGESALLSLLRQGECLHRSARPAPAAASARSAVPTNNISLQNGRPVWGRQLHPLHGLHLPLPRGGHRVRQKEPRQAALSF